MIAISELLAKRRKALSSAMKPNLTANEQPKVPDVKNFQQPPVHPDDNCYGNDKAISIDIIDESGGLEITICTFLDFEIIGELSAEGILDGLEDVSISLELDAGFVLKGALSTGVKITVTTISNIQIEFDPIIAQLYLESDLTGSLSLGLVKAAVSGDALMQGSFSLGYCSSCDGTYSEPGYERTGENSTFYYNRLIGFDIGGALELSAGVPGVSIGVGVEIRVSDDDVFDEAPPVVVLPDAQALLDSMKFSPQSAVSKSETLSYDLVLCT